MPKLVIVESPAKAKTIERFLGSGYTVLASFGHVRDLPESAEDIPEEHKKKPWAKLGVDVENGFAPLYVVPKDKARRVSELRKASKGIDELLLATDEDREGESISWHVLQLLKPSSKVPVRRIVFHEITPEAIRDSLRKPRAIDEHLVRAQETRRILDRLYGYTLSPLLWKKVAPKLSAGRVQSVAVRLTVERERERMRFQSAEYWDMVAELQAEGGTFRARLIERADRRVATGKDFDPSTGLLQGKAVHLKEADARSLADRARDSKPWRVASIDTTPGTEKPPVPFMTSTLQQEANRKLRMTSRRTMQIAQALYEGVDLGGERTGLITYMRTDSLHLAERALHEAREVIRDLYGPEYLPDKPVHYKTKAKGAQEAHEAIRPTDLSRRPQDVARYLDKDQLALYELIWKRTIACQMLPARVLKTAVKVEVTVGDERLVFHASGKQIVFPGFLKAYVEGSDDPDAELDSKETLLPPLQESEVLDLRSLDAEGHSTKPPARYTEASLVKRLEDEGVGRPSTYASIIGTVQDRGYVFKRGNELIPTFTAFAVTELLERDFTELVDVAFTARMEGELDQIADGKRDWVQHLREFYLGTGPKKGLEQEVQSRQRDIPYPSIPIGLDPETGAPIVVKVGRYGTYLQRGEGGNGNTANVPADQAPAELSIEKALALLANKSGVEEPISIDPNGVRVFRRKGRFGPYLEVEQSEEEKAAGAKPKRVTLPAELASRPLSDDEVATLLSFPRSLGDHPELGQEVTVSIGQYGPYVKCGTEIRNVADWQEAARLSLDGAVDLLAQPKGTRSRAGSSTPRAEIKPIQEFGELPDTAGPVRVMPGRYGPYVTDGKTNATLPKALDPALVTAEQARELILAKAAQPPSKLKRFSPRAARTKRAGRSK